MPSGHISYRSDFGVALHETGLNRLSAGLRAEKPELFAFSTEIPIVRPSPTDPGHVLTLYAVADEPIAFNLYPVQQTPAIQQDGFFISANILFTLTDSRLGAVTRIRIHVEAAGQVVRAKDQLKVRLLAKPDGSPWFDITSIEGEHPAALKLLEGRVDGDLSLEAVFPSRGDDETARSFRAIMNYLITLFLKEGLTKVVTEFPLPSLAKLIEAGPLGTIAGRELYVRNDAIYLTLGDENPGPGGFPVPFPPADIAIGVSERGLQRIMDAMSPMAIPIDVGTDDTSFRMRSSNFRIRTIKTNLLPGHDHLFGQVYFGGTLDIRLQFKAFGHWVRTPWLPLPIDDTFSQYAGLIRPYIGRSNIGAPNEKFELRMEPDSKFIELWAILIVTNYRGYFRDLFRRMVESVKDQLIYKKLKKIPIIGWIIDAIIDLTGDILAWALGSLFDMFMSTTLTAIINTVGRIALQFMKRQEFVALKIEQAMVKSMTGLEIKSGDVLQLEDGRGGELFVGLSFAQGQFPPPPAPTPIPPAPGPQPLPDPPLPGPQLPSLPEYGAGDFTPPFALGQPDWSDGDVQRYEVEIKTSRPMRGEMTLRFESVAGGWRITKRLAIQGLPADVVAVAEYTAEGLPIRANYHQEGGLNTGAPTVEFTQVADFSAPGTALTSTALGPLASFERRIAVMDRARLDFDEFWPFRLAHMILADGAAGVFGRIEFADPMEVENWSRQVPVRLSVAATGISLPGQPGPVQGFAITASDEDGKTSVAVAPGRGVVEMRAQGKETEVVLRRV
ncbi:hypothetical protein ACFB49_34020 [Sphingomonas sp. DBB INV C78]|uniref:hypothetical protein n=1 Tax=Sphingomonas sp. DBB INV C78 TaxID=3349434 RepID=UPI0036D3E6C0